VRIDRGALGRQHVDHVLHVLVGGVVPDVKRIDQADHQRAHAERGREFEREPHRGGEPAVLGSAMEQRPEDEQPGQEGQHRQERELDELRAREHGAEDHDIPSRRILEKAHEAEDRRPRAQCARHVHRDEPPVP